MALAKSKGEKVDYWKLILITFTFSALSPEYIAPVLLAGSLIYTLVKTKVQKLSLSQFTTGYAFLIFIGWMVIGAFYAKSITSPLVSLALWLFMLSGLWLCTVWIDTEEKIEKIIYGGSFAAGVNGFIAIIQAIARTLFGRDNASIINPIWRILDIGFEKIVSILPEFIQSRLPKTQFRIYPDRSCGTFSNPLFLATFLVAMLPFTFYCLLNAKTKRQKIFGLICVALNLGGVGTTLSRGPYIVTVAVLVLLLIYGGKKALQVLGVGAAGGATILIFFREIIVNRLLTLGSTTDKSVKSRKLILNALSEKIPDKFVFGYGTGFDSVRSILHNEYKIMQPHAHNIILEIQMENGIIGVVLFLMACCVFAYKIVRLFVKGGSARNLAITFGASIIAMCMCGMTDCIFYGLKPLQYFMLIIGLTQAASNIFLKDEPVFVPVKMLFKKFNKESDSVKEKEEARV